MGSAATLGRSTEVPAAERDWCGDQAWPDGGAPSSESVRAWLGTVARWPVSPRLIGDRGYMARQSALDWGLSRNGHPHLIGDCLEMASQSALNWGLRLKWQGSPRLIGDCREVASQSALDWGLSRSGQSVRA
ncbi:hypothetical protein ACLB2K_059555 [Fragaria x ananassa]